MSVKASGTVLRKEAGTLHLTQEREGKKERSTMHILTRMEHSQQRFRFQVTEYTGIFYSSFRVTLGPQRQVFVRM
ncbi:uncharacterized protein Z518_05232 [Rhinocladiella mackenziei CBS 650.93]|uniref:Uncharacterized protein n=1 Tax=Rhinocladiella mackenziei CBS 650.93 TaxID=1442369 RepID=A0A0D2IEX6_9EURO|nr:uncharacterized protein Z518_05232 [Rhinocladiella mackenziei CBS 650.93]KIX04364.1 hypothetical protein Z518_05232 [Rhinocladiella mackenziei CBS 650.93]